MIMIRKSREISWTDLIWYLKISEISGCFIFTGKLLSYKSDLWDINRIGTGPSHISRYHQEKQCSA
jgi:hypothetical protein